MQNEIAKLQTYAAFWPFYLGQHAQRLTRRIHVFGTLLAFLFLAKAVICFSLVWLLAALLVGYGFAWLAHTLAEKNHPATFTYPLWSLFADLHMSWLWVSGTLEAELIRNNILS